MVVRVRPESMKQLVIRLTADFLILAGVVGILVWVGGVGEGLVYQYLQGRQFARIVAGEDSGVVQEEGAVPESRPQAVFPQEAVKTGGAAAPQNKPRRLFSKLDALFRQDPELVGRLEAPEIGLSVMIREGTDEDTLRKAAGHLRSSVEPGEHGNFVVLGHRDTFFRPLRNIEKGDLIRVRTRQGKFTYVVESFEVIEPDAVRIDNGSEAVSTLITCFPFTYIGPAPHRFVVHARLKESEVFF